jgi:hypothetical protein
MDHLRKSLVTTSVRRQKRRVVHAAGPEAAPEAAPPCPPLESIAGVLKDATGREVRELCADAVLLLLTRLSEACEVELGRTLYSFVVHLTMQMYEWRLKEEGADIHLGDVAARLGSFPALAYFFMHGEQPQRDASAAVAWLCPWLDNCLPNSSPRVRFTTEHNRRCSRLAFRCAIPFAYDMSFELPDEHLEFVSRALTTGNDKSVRMALNFIANGGKPKPDADQGKMAAGKGAPRDSDDDDSLDESEDGDEAEVRDEDVWDEGDTFVSLLGRKPIALRHMRPLVTPMEFYSIYSRLDEGSVLVVQQAFGFEGAYEIKPQSISAIKKRIEAGKPFAPRCCGSVLRAYMREVHSVKVDDAEPHIECMMDTIRVSGV